MAHHGNFCFDHAGDELEAALAAFDFQCLGTGFLHEAHGVVERLGSVHVVAAVGHVCHYERAPCTAAHGPRVVKHLLNRNRQRAVVTEHDHADGVADENDVHAGFVEQTSRGIVVGRQAGDLLGLGRGTC